MAEGKRARADQKEHGAWPPSRPCGASGGGATAYQADREIFEWFMNSDTRAKRLISELVSDPARFAHEGKDYLLLQEYLYGLPKSTLIPLLVHSDPQVQQSAVFVASELGGDAASDLVAHIPAFDPYGDPHTQWAILEIFFLSTRERNGDYFVHLLKGLECETGPLHRLAMRLVSKANLQQLHAGKRACRTAELTSAQHEFGIDRLLHRDILRPEEVIHMLADEQQLLRTYGAIAASTLSGEHSNVIKIGKASSDPDVSQFCRELSS